MVDLALLQSVEASVRDEYNKPTDKRRGTEEIWRVTTMEWRDYDDFERKYGSDNNLDNYAKRLNVWYIYNTLGMLVREKLIEPEFLYPIISGNVMFLWNKFKDILPEWERRYGGDALSDFKFLNDEMERIALIRFPSHKIPETLTKYVPSG
ncbi:MAG: hypothetical protein NTY03_04550 [Candidatus Bathyarchaeota archaeon]|nr:hypothetical protein [Candidatus Bathyarchaeota archaeon]